MARVCRRPSPNLVQEINKDGGLVSSKCIQTLDGQRYAIQSYIAGDRLRSIEKAAQEIGGRVRQFLRRPSSPLLRRFT